MKTVLITGASSGIGKELDFKYASENYNLVLVARRSQLLNQLKKDITEKYNVDVRCYKCDLTENPKAVYDYCHKNKIKVDVLINNAGVGDYGKFIDCDLDKALNMIELNNKALVSLTYYFLQDMKKNNEGHILNVGSVASFVPGPYMAVYYATKSFVLSFSEAIRDELRNDNIKVTVLCPGPTKSEFWDVAGASTSGSYNNIFARTPAQAAKTGYDAMVKNKAYTIDGLPYKLLIGVARHLPIELTTRAIGYIQVQTKNKK